MTTTLLRSPLLSRLRAAALPALLAALAPAAAAPAQTVDFAETVTFGDSLTANALLGFPFRIPLYGDDPMQAVFDQGAVGGDRLTSYAVPGAESGLMLFEIGVYAARLGSGAQGMATLVSFEIGGNDVLNEWSLLSGNPPGADPLADARIDAMIQTMGRDLSLLWTTHPTARFVVWTIPDITYTPKHWADRGTARGANFRAHIARINRLIRLLDAVPNVVVLDLESLIRSYATNPPVLRGQALLGPPTTGRYAGLFADDIHPTAVANALLANEIIARCNSRWAAAIAPYTEAELAALARIP